MDTVNFLKHIVEHQHNLVYVIMLLGTIFEGEITILSVGVLINLGALHLDTSLMVILIGALFKTLAGYSLGMFIRKHWSKVGFFRFFEKRVRKITPQFKERPFWSIFISKFIISANIIIILFAGFERIDFKRYLRAELSAIVIWAPGLIALGYFFSYTALHVSRQISEFTLIVFALVVGYYILDKIISYVYEAIIDFRHE